MKKLTDKILDRSEIKSKIDRNDGVVVFTNGCFDILHLGHVRYLHEAKEKGDILIVGVNSDTSVKRLKGASRPVQNEEARMEILAALESVDYVIPFSEDTPYELIKTITPDILIKGGDYAIKDIVGGDWVIDHGGDVMTITFTENQSTSNIISKINKL